jgi:hypothetical protein
MSAAGSAGNGSPMDPVRSSAIFTYPSVVEIVSWPARRCILATSTPARASQVMPVSRHVRKLTFIVVALCSVRRERVTFARARCLRIRIDRRFSLRSPIMGNTAAVSSAARSCIALSRGTSAAGMGTSRTPLRVFGGFTVFESSSYAFVT